jgi:hypothetical protein
MTRALRLLRLRSSVEFTEVFNVGGSNIRSMAVLRSVSAFAPGTRPPDAIEGGQVGFSSAC